MKNLFFLLSIFICSSTFAQEVLDNYNFTTTKSGLKYHILKQGKGDFPVDGDKVWVHYLSKFANDSVFDSSEDRGPLDIFLGQGQVIKGWEEGIKFLKPGGSILLVVPPELAYGKDAYEKIPANSTLIFEVSLIQINKALANKPFNIDGKKEKVKHSGIKYIVIEKGKGRRVKPGDNAYVNYIAMLADGTIFDSSYKNREPVRITVGTDQVFKGWDLSVQLMRAGSKYRVIIPPKLAYDTVGYKNIIPPNSTVVMDMYLERITPEIKVKQWISKTADTIETSSGLKYIVFESGTGDLVNSQDIVEVHYSGYFTNGKLFDSSVKREESIKFPVGANVVIDGWDEGLKLMRKGAKFKLLIPSNLAYGIKGVPPLIDPNTDLIFDIELIDIIR